MSNVEEGRRRAQQQRRTVAIDHDTLDYDRANARLPWGERILARNTLSIVYSTAASVPSACICWGAKTLVDAVSSNPDVRSGAWTALSVVAMEIAITAFKTSAFEHYLCSKPMHYIIVVASWSAAFVATRGNLGAPWAVMVCWLAWFVAILFNDVFPNRLPLRTALWSATLNPTVLVLGALAVAVRRDDARERCKALQIETNPHTCAPLFPSLRFSAGLQLYRASGHRLVPSRALDWRPVPGHRVGFEGGVV